MGEAALQQRLIKMGEKTNLNNFYVQSLYGWDMLDKTYQVALEDFIIDKKIQIIGFDPLGSVWNGYENKRESVKQLTDYFDSLLDRFSVSIILTHHWRKMTKEFKEGGEMAAGSYGWEKWLDNHVTIAGEEPSLILACQKNRNQKKWERILIGLNEENLSFEFKADFQNVKKFTEEDLLGLFNSFRVEKVTQKDLIERGKNMCSKSTILNLINSSNQLKVNKEKRPYLIYRVEKQMEQTWEE